MPARADLEPIEPPSSGHPHDLDRLDDRPGGTATKQLLDPVQLVGRPFDDAADAAVRLVGDPPGEALASGDPEHVIPEADALDASLDGHFEALERLVRQRFAVRLAHRAAPRGQPRSRRPRASSGRVSASTSPPT